MIEFVLVAVIALLLAERAYTGRAHARERRHLTNAVIAKNGGELIALDRERKPVETSKDRARAVQLDNPVGI